jgi:hypothetical protein
MTTDIATRQFVNPTGCFYYAYRVVTSRHRLCDIYPAKALTTSSSCRTFIRLNTASMSLLPLSEAIQYTSRKALEDTLQSHVKENGYAITIQRSNKKDSTIYYYCDRLGVYKAHHGLNEVNRLRDPGTRLTDCPFLVRANLKDEIWTIKVRNGNYNHPATSPVAHPIHRRPPQEIVKQVADLTASGSTPREIVSTVRLTIDHLILSWDVYNLRQKIKAKNLVGKTSMEALVAQLSKKQFRF